MNDTSNGEPKKKKKREEEEEKQTAETLAFSESSYLPFLPPNVKKPKTNKKTHIHTYKHIFRSMDVVNVSTRPFRFRDSFFPFNFFISLCLFVGRRWRIDLNESRTPKWYETWKRWCSLALPNNAWQVDNNISQSFYHWYQRCGYLDVIAGSSMFRNKIMRSNVVHCLTTSNTHSSLLLFFS